MTSIPTYNSTLVRDLNVLHYMMLNSQGNSYNEFKAFTSAGWSTTASINVSNFWHAGGSGSGSDGFNWNNVAKLLLSKAAGVTGALDFSAKQVFNGSNPLEFTFNCFLLLENSYQEDIVEPLNLLLSLLLPTRSQEVTEPIRTAAKKPLDQLAKEFDDNQLAKGNPNSTGGVWALLSQAVDMIQNFIGSVYTLHNPGQFDSDMNISTRLNVGNLTIDDTMLTSATIKFPQVFMKDSEGNLVPDRVDLTLTFRTLRIATAGGMLKFKEV